MTAIADTIPRTALVTGAARRIGRAVALDLAEAGFAVAVHYSASGGEAEAVAESIRARGGRAVAIAADLADEAATATLVERAEAALGPLGVLVNNASTFERDEALSATRASWDLHMEVNLRAPFVLSQDFARRLPAAAEGVIVNLLDQRVWNPTPHFTTYTLSKAGLWTLTQTLALAFAPRIRVVGVGPGPALPSVRQTADQFAAQCAGTPLARGTSPEEIAAAVRFALACPSFTGQMIALDGGQHLQWGRADTAPEE
ncbi:SDR family oxidoreductase [Magnetospirillum sp. UT-4]|uniref:SDR family oxidoreductase n=1 Tax=Magnetospirillum sp. UT-4 TaxID=2681467 RepID=UPI00137E92DD|nr:SDR family oxidoreductase [Magnetospirillum sp. UT-4]CAA7623243.1 putative Glucose 1-dehydrogenase 2 [Magnetospirillum sp. UT-4]